MEDKDIKILEEKIDKGYIYVNCGNATEKAITNLLQAYKQDEKVIQEMAKYIVNLIEYNNSEEIRDVEEIITYFRKKCE